MGIISMAAGILIGRFTGFGVGGFSVSTFTEGLLMGLSRVPSLFCLATRRRG
jgi:hypothetical protein